MGRMFRNIFPRSRSFPLPTSPFVPCLSRTRARALTRVRVCSPTLSRAHPSSLPPSLPPSIPSFLPPSLPPSFFPPSQSPSLSLVIPSFLTAKCKMGSQSEHASDPGSALYLPATQPLQSLLVPDHPALHAHAVKWLLPGSETEFSGQWAHSGDQISTSQRVRNIHGGAGKTTEKMTVRP